MNFKINLSIKTNSNNTHSSQKFKNLTINKNSNINYPSKKSGISGHTTKGSVKKSSNKPTPIHSKKISFTKTITNDLLNSNIFQKPNTANQSSVTNKSQRIKKITEIYSKTPDPGTFCSFQHVSYIIKILIIFL